MIKITQAAKYSADWRWGAAGAALAYAAGILAILNLLPFICGGMTVASFCSFVKSVKPIPDKKSLHTFVPKNTTSGSKE